MRNRCASSDECGSTLPLILGFFLIALLVIGASVAATDAFIQQRGLQDVCDGASAAAAASAVQLGRGSDLGQQAGLKFTAVQSAVRTYLDRDATRRGVTFRIGLSADHEKVTLRCEEREQIALGAMFGFAAGVEHVATSTAQAVLNLTGKRFNVGP